LIQAPFALAGHNPDVLTCIANLSNDEVFTPPELANQMLDTLEQSWANSNNGENIWANKEVTFLDPCTKSGVFLREIVKRLNVGLTVEIPDLTERVNHILIKQVFGIGTTQLTSLLARRSVYCSKYANSIHSVARTFTNNDGNIWFERTEHSWVNGKCKFCGANRRDYDRGNSLETHAYAFIHTEETSNQISKLFGAGMRFDVVIGNPPYQLGQSGGDSVGGFAMPIYHKFVRAAKSLDPMYVVMVTPSRWFAGGRGLDEFRKEMLSDKRLRRLIDFTFGKEAFPGTKIEGGVSYFVWDRTWSGDCEVQTVENGIATSPSLKRSLGAYDVLVRRNEAVPILEKVLAVTRSDGFSTFDKNVSSIQPFSIRTNFLGSKTSDGMRDPVRLIRNGDDMFIERKDIPRNIEWVDEWKVLLGRAYGLGSTYPHKVYNEPIIAGPGTACTETYLVAGLYKTESQAKKLKEFLQTRFVRFLVSLRKNTQDIYNERFLFVPNLPMSENWTDEKLYEKYGISDHEIAFIESVIRPMDLDGD
jgi:site-specific DNA-methyltransferase (adenine-specific)